MVVERLERTPAGLRAVFGAVVTLFCVFLKEKSLRALQCHAMFVLCPVPKDCVDASVHNATAAMQAIDSFWSQPAGFSWRVCTIGDPASDECDPSTNAAPDNALAFVTVFVVQCCAIALGHVVLMSTVRQMVADNRQRMVAAGDGGSKTRTASTPLRGRRKGAE
jgi:hypothetical protein